MAKIQSNGQQGLQALYASKTGLGGPLNFAVVDNVYTCLGCGTHSLNGSFVAVCRRCHSVIVDPLPSYDVHFLCEGCANRRSSCRCAHSQSLPAGSKTQVIFREQPKYCCCECCSWCRCSCWCLCCDFLCEFLSSPCEPLDECCSCTRRCGQTRCFCSFCPCECC